jgi:hypothetical protein
MPCSCQNKRQTYEVIPNAGKATRAAFTGSNQATAESVADRYAMSVVRDKKTGEAVYFAWPKGTYEVVLQDGQGEAVTTMTVRTDADKRPLRAAADEHAAQGAVVRAAGGGAVVYPLTTALTASGSTLTAAAPAAVVIGK